jgi:hypothetical protein
VAVEQAARCSVAEGRTPRPEGPGAGNGKHEVQGEGEVNLNDPGPSLENLKSLQITLVADSEDEKYMQLIYDEKRFNRNFSIRLGENLFIGDVIVNQKKDPVNGTVTYEMKVIHAKG